MHHKTRHETSHGCTAAQQLWTMATADSDSTCGDSQTKADPILVELRRWHAHQAGPGCWPQWWGKPAPAWHWLCPPCCQLRAQRAALGSGRSQMVPVQVPGALQAAAKSEMDLLYALSR